MQARLLSIIAIGLLVIAGASGYCCYDACLSNLEKIIGVGAQCNLDAAVSVFPELYTYLADLAAMYISKGYEMTPPPSCCTKGTSCPIAWGYTFGCHINTVDATMTIYLNTPPRALEYCATCNRLTCGPSTRINGTMIKPIKTCDIIEPPKIILTCAYPLDIGQICYQKCRAADDLCSWCESCPPPTTCPPDPTCPPAPLPLILSIATPSNGGSFYPDSGILRVSAINRDPSTSVSCRFYESNTNQIVTVQPTWNPGEGAFAYEFAGPPYPVSGWTGLDCVGNDLQRYNYTAGIKVTVRPAINITYPDTIIDVPANTNFDVYVDILNLNPQPTVNHVRCSIGGGLAVVDQTSPFVITLNSGSQLGQQGIECTGWITTGLLIGNPRYAYINVV